MPNERPDEDVDTSEIPELNGEFFANATLTRPGEDLIPAFFTTDENSTPFTLEQFERDNRDSPVPYLMADLAKLEIGQQLTWNGGASGSVTFTRVEAPQDLTVARRLALRTLARRLSLRSNERLHALDLKSHDLVVAFEPPDFETMMDAMSWGSPPEIARIEFKNEPNGLCIISLTLFANGTFAVGSHVAFKTGTFQAYMETYNRALTLIQTYRLQPRYP